MYHAYFIQHSIYLHYPPPFVLSHFPSHYYSVAFQGRCAQVLQIYGNRKWTDPHFQEKIWPISVHPSEYIQPRNAQTNLHACRQKHPARNYAFFRWKYCFLGHTKWSTKHSGNNQRGAVKDTRSQVLEAVYISAPVPPPLSLSLSARMSWYTSIVHPVLTSRVYCFFVFYLFRYSLISIHSLKKNSTRTVVGVILNTLWWNAPMFYHQWCQTNAALMRTSKNNPLLSSNCTTWLIHVHPTWSEENILVVLHIIPLDLQFRHVQRHVR